MAYFKWNFVFLTEITDEAFITFGFLSTKVEVAMQCMYVQLYFLHHQRKGYRISPST